MTRARVTLAIAFGALALTACGGGGGDDDGGNGTNCTTNPTAPGCTPSTTNTAPVAKANGPYTTVAGAALSLSAAGSSDAQDLPQALKYEWLLSNAVVANGAQPTYTFATAGSYTLTLRVTDTKGLTATDNATVTVNALSTPPVPPPAGSTTGTMGVILTDAPFPFDTIGSANIFIVRIDAQIAEPTADAANTSLAKPTNGDPNAGWVTVTEPNAVFDVYALRNGATRTLGQGGVVSGTYRGFRFVIDVTKSDLTYKGNAKPAIAWGSTGLLGVKVVPAAPVTVPANGAVNLLVDFDLGRSFDLTNGSTLAGGFTYLRERSLRSIAPTQTGADIGRVTVDATVAPGVTVELLTSGTALGDFSRDRVVATAGTDAQGVYRMTNIAPGNYVRRFTFPARYNVNASSGDVTIAAGASASRSFEFEPLK